MAACKLIDANCRAAVCPPDRQRQRLHDGGGLYLEVAPTGSRRWFWKYQAAGRERRLALGSYPAVSLSSARLARDAARMARASGVDLVRARRVGQLRAQVASTLGDSFYDVAHEWHKRQSVGWGDSHASRTMRNIGYLVPHLGPVPVSEIAAIDLLAAVRRVEQRGTVAAARVLGTARQVFAYAIATGRATRNVASDLSGALTPHRPRHHAAITELLALGGLLRAMHGYEGHPCTVVAVMLSPMLLVRPGELRHMEWTELDLDAATWSIPSAKMKMKADHIVPLPTQAVEMLRSLQPITGAGRYVFSSLRTGDRPMSENTVSAALRALGYTSTVQTAHGFRATARTILDEVLGQRVDLIEHQLPHAVRDANGRAYNRTAHLPARVVMLQKWADYLDTLRTGATIIQMPKRATAGDI